MTTAADDRAVEGAFEAALAGRTVPEGAAGLAAFTGAVRSAAAQPGRPNAALAELLSSGLLTDLSSPSTRTAPTAGTPSRGRTRRRTTVIFSALVAKLLSAGAVAQAATGAGVVVVVVTGAGAAGVLPEDAQQTFSDLTGIDETVEEPADDLVTEPEPTTPVDDGEGADPTDPDVEVPEAETEDGDETGELTDAEASAAWAEDGLSITTQAEFKVWLALGKENGWVTGQAVSAAAHARNEARKAARNGVEDPAETPEAEAPEVETEVESDDSGKSKGNGSGKGKAKGNGQGQGRGGRG